MTLSAVLSLAFGIITGFGIVEYLDRNLHR